MRSLLGVSGGSKRGVPETPHQCSRDAISRPAAAARGSGCGRSSGVSFDRRPSACLLERARQRLGLLQLDGDRPGTHRRKCPKPRQSPMIHAHPRRSSYQGRRPEIPATPLLSELKLGARAGALQAGGHRFDPGGLHSPPPAQHPPVGRYGASTVKATRFALRILRVALGGDRVDTADRRN